MTFRSDSAVATGAAGCSWPTRRPPRPTTAVSQPARCRRRGGGGRSDGPRTGSDHGDSARPRHL